MPTVTTDTTINALSANETIVVGSGATATINRPIAQRAGAISPTTGGGRFLLDGRNLRQLTVASTTGLALGQICTFGNGVTGEVVEISGLRLQFRSLSGAVPSGTSITASGGYSSATTSASSIGLLVFMQTESTLNTMAAGFTFEVQGDWLTLGTGTGASGFGLTMYLAAFVPSIEVETGSGTGVYEKWLNVLSAANLATMGSAEHGRAFWQATTSATLTFGNGTNGNVIPAGARVRVPNVMMVSVNTSNQPVYTATVTSRNRWSGSSSGGSLLLEGCILSGFHALAQGLEQIRFNRTAFGTAQLGVCSNLQILHSGCATDNAATTVCSIPLAIATIQDSVFLTATSARSLDLISSTVQFLRSTCLMLNRTGSIAGVRLDACTSTISDLALIGAGATFFGGRHSLTNILYSDRTNGLTGQTASAPVDALTFQYCLAVVISSIGFLPNAAVFRNYYLAFSGCEAIAIDASSYTSSLNLQAQGLGLINFLLGETKYLSVRKAHYFNGRDSSLLPSGAALPVVNSYLANSSSSQTYGTLARSLSIIASVYLGVRGAVPVAGSFVNSLNTTWHQFFTSATQATVGVFFNVADYRGGLEVVSGSPRFDSTGRMLLDAGAQVIYTSPLQAFLGCSALENVSIDAPNTSIEYRLIKNPNITTEFSGAWQALTITNVAAEAGVSATTGFRVQFRLTCTSGTSNVISRCSVIGTTSTALQNAVDYPGRYPVVELSGFLTGSGVCLLDTANRSIFRRLPPTLNSQLIQLPYPGANANYTARARRYGMLSVDLIFRVDEFSNAISFAGRQSLNPAIVLSESAAAALTPIVVDHATQTITITTSRSLDEIFHRLQWRSSQLEDLPFPVLMESNADRTVFTCPYNVVIADGVIVSGSGKTLNLGTQSLTLGADANITASVVSGAGVRFRLYGLPTHAGASPVMRLKRISTGVITNPAITDGEAYFTLAAGEDYEVRADARGYAASRFIVINSTAASSLQITLDRVVDDDGSPVYELGDPAVASLIAFDLATFRVTIAYSAANPKIDAASALRAIEDYLATPQGLELTAHPIYANNAVTLPRDMLTSALNPLRIQSADGNSQAPELLFPVTLAGGSDVYAAYDLVRPLKFPTVLNLAQSGSAVGGGLTTTQDAALSRIDNKVASIAIASGKVEATIDISLLAKEETLNAKASQASVNALPTADQTATSIWSATVRSLTDKADFGLSAASIQAIWEYTARSLSSFGTLAADVWAFTARTITARPPNTAADTQGFEVADRAKLDAIPVDILLATDSRLENLNAPIAGISTAIDTTLADNFAALPDATQIADAVWARTTRTITARPPETASPADVQTSVTVSGGFEASDRTKLNSIPANPLLASDTRLDRLDTNISSRSSLTLSQIESSTVLAKTTQLPPAPDNTSIAAIKAKTDALPSSPASTSDVQTTVSGGFTNADRTALGAIPTTAQTITAIESSAVIAKEATVASRASQTSVNSLPSAAQIATAVWGATTRALTDKDGFSLSAAGVAAIWSATTRSLTSFGTLAADVWTQATRSLTARPPNTAAPTDVQVRVTGGFEGADRAKLNSIPADAATAINAALADDFAATNAAIADVEAAIDLQSEKINDLHKINGLQSGVSVTASATGRQTSDGAIAQNITRNTDGSKTMARQ